MIDASVFPSVPSANINAATIMLAEKASDLLLGNPALKPEALPYHCNQKPNGSGKKYA
ncbi:choline dehydrogenase [compost metagenome]